MSGGGGGGGCGFGSGNREGLRLSLDGLCAGSPSVALTPGSLGLFSSLAVSSPGGAAPTLTTPTLTPTALRNIEQMFLEGGGGGGPLHENAAHFVPPDVKAADRAHDISTPTIANVILEMSNGQGIPGAPTTVESVVRQLQEAEEQQQQQRRDDRPTRIAPPPPLLVIPPSRPTSLSLSASPSMMLLPSTKLKRRTLQSVISQLSPSLAAAAKPSSSSHVPAQTMPTSPHFLSPSPSAERRGVDAASIFHPDLSPLHSLASLSAIQNPLPVLAKAAKVENDALNLTVERPRAKSSSDSIQLLLKASKESDGVSAPPRKKKSANKRGVGRPSPDAMEGIDLSGLTDQERRKAMRRLRNKEAAARCRKRRLDQTHCLQDQVDMWERRRDLAHREIDTLRSEQSNLVALLQDHRSSDGCRASEAPVPVDDGGKTGMNNNEESNPEEPEKNA